MNFINWEESTTRVLQIIETKGTPTEENIPLTYKEATINV